MRVGIAQLRIEAGNVQANVDRAATAIESAAERGVDLVVLPELFNVGFFAFDAYDAAAEPIGGPTHDRLATLAADHGMALVAGSIVEDLDATATQTDHSVPARTGLANTTVCFDSSGTVQAIYRKTHLWGYDAEEAERLVPGESLGITEFQGFTVGLTTCYDLRFPELYRGLLDAGVSLFVVPSAWPYPRVEHWRALPRARAIENLAYVATANGTGSMGDATLCGRSTVYGPWGTTVASTSDDPTLLTADLDPDRVTAIRAEFPPLRDRRTRDFYVSQS